MTLNPLTTRNPLRYWLSLTLLFCTTFTQANVFDDVKQGDLGQLKQRSSKDLQLRDDFGFTALDYARDYDQNAVAQWLISQKIDSGIEGNLIQQVQWWLQLLGYKVNNNKGIINPAVKKDILQFQRDYQLPETGVIRPSWLNQLQNYAIFALQLRLHQALSLDASTLPLSGQLDNKTVETLKNFQANHQLSQTGQLSLLTIEKLLNTKLDKTTLRQVINDSKLNTTTPLSNDPIKTSTTTASTSDVLTTLTAETKPVPSATEEKIEPSLTPSNQSNNGFLLSDKAKSGKVLNLQAWLALAGWPAGELDGDMGPKTREIIKEYQTSLGQKPTGQLHPDWETVLENKIRINVQQRLNELGFYQGKADGINGLQTHAAIKAFEVAHKIQPTGSLNAFTLAALFSPDAKANPAEASSSTEEVALDTKAMATTEEESKPSAIDKKPTTSSATKVQLAGIRLGNDEALLKQQLKLAYVGLYTTLADGKPGKATQGAIREFQTQQKIKIDGELGKQTEQLLDTAVIRQLQQTLAQQGKLQAEPTGTLGPKTRQLLGDITEKHAQKRQNNLDVLSLLAMIDDRNQTRYAKQYQQQVKEKSSEMVRIRDAQSYLIGLGLLAGDAHGRLDNTTKNAIANFRKQQGLKRNNELNAALMPYLKSAAIKKLQNNLKRLGYRLDTDGQLGTTTQNAIRDFQRKNKYPVSGDFSLRLLTDTSRILRNQELAKNRRAPIQVERNTVVRITPDTEEQADGDLSTQVAITKPTERNLNQILATPSTNTGTNEILRSEPDSTIKGTLQVLKNAKGDVMGCKISNMTVAANWCQDVKKANSQCSVLYRNGRVLSVRCG